MNRNLRFAALLAALICGGSAGAFAQQAATPYYANTGLITTAPKTTVARQSPVITSGFGTGAALVAGVNSAAFVFNVGTGGTATSGVITLGAGALHGWSCQATDITSVASFDDKVLPTSQTTITVQNYPAAGGALSAWNAGDQVEVICEGY
jgi:hypothetical protein